MRGKLILLMCSCWFALSAPAIILFRTADIEANTTAPADAANLNSGWQYQGSWGAFLGTPIAPHFFISAKHIGNQGAFSYGGVIYRIVQRFADPRSDLVILQVEQEFPTFAPLYTKLDESGKRVIDFGRGTRRGVEVMFNGALVGWRWGSGDGRRRWGENIVNAIVPNGTENELLAADFNASGLANECHLSTGDSGGGAFINDNGTWKLGGINFAVDGPFYTSSTGAGKFDAALFDARGFYQQQNNSFVLIAGDAPVPSAFYATRIARRLPWIASTIAAPQLGREGNFLTLTYTRLYPATSDLAYLIEQSTDLVRWENATTIDELSTPNGSTQIVKSKVAITGDTLFLRLRVKRP